MANIFEDAWNAGKEWAGDVKSDAEKYVTKKVIQKKVNDWGSSVTKALGGPLKMTPELEAAGWKRGLDNIPYNPAECTCCKVVSRFKTAYTIRHYVQPRLV